MTLYFTPAWMMFGLNVSRISARIARDQTGSHSRSISRSAVSESSSPAAIARNVEPVAAGSASAAVSSIRVMTGVIRIGPATASARRSRRR
jgi:hypothetical protein